MRVLERGIGASDDERRDVAYYPRATACSTAYAEQTERLMPRLYCEHEVTLGDLWRIHKGAFALALLVWPVLVWPVQQVQQVLVSECLLRAR